MAPPPTDGYSRAVRARRTTGAGTQKLVHVKTLARNSKRRCKPFGYPSVGYWSKEINRTLTGGRKKLSRDIDDATMAGASLEACRFAALRSPLGRLGSVLYTCKRLHRMRGRFHRWIHVRTGAQLPTDLHHDPPKFWIQSSLESPKNRRMRSRRLPTIRATPIAVREPIYIRKK